MTVWAIVVAAGRGERFGGPKQLEVVAGKRVLDWSVEAARAACDGVVVVVPSGAEPGPSGRLSGERRDVEGGDTRSESVRNGLAAVPDDAEVIVVHDAARPLATDALFEQVIASVLAGAAAAVPGVAVSDSLREIDGGVVDRGRVVAVQTPQAFRADLLRRAHRDEPDASDDATLVEMIGGKVEIVPGETTNFKITTSHDLKVARMLVAEESAS